MTYWQAVLLMAGVIVLASIAKSFQVFILVVIVGLVLVVVSTKQIPFIGKAQ